MWWCVNLYWFPMFLDFSMWKTVYNRHGAWFQQPWHCFYSHGVFAFGNALFLQSAPRNLSSVVLVVVVVVGIRYNTALCCTAFVWIIGYKQIGHRYVF